MAYEAWMLAAMDEAGYNGIREEHIKKVASVMKCGSFDFETACRVSGIRAENFSEEDRDAAEREAERDI